MADSSVGRICTCCGPGAVRASPRDRWFLWQLFGRHRVVRTNERSLYYVLGGGKAIHYPVGVGRAGRQWSGTTFINGKDLRPAWVPPPVVRRDKPNLPFLIPSGAPNNPLGAAVMTLAGGERAIHGTNNPASIGGAVSYGCIRMFNADVLDLYGRVGLGTTVIVTR
jgi:lipoprotein-anchoring transpeptidase ErfK/SrfK